MWLWGQYHNQSAFAVDSVILSLCPVCPHMFGITHDQLSWSVNTLVQVGFVFQRIPFLVHMISCEYGQYDSLLPIL